jgi:hypothetical protein
MWHNQYVLKIEHFSKCLKLMPLSNYNNEGATYAYVEKIFSIGLGFQPQYSLTKVWNCVTNSPRIT